MLDSEQICISFLSWTILCLTGSGAKPGPSPSWMASWYLGVGWTRRRLFSFHKTFPLRRDTELQPRGSTGHQLYVSYSQQWILMAVCWQKVSEINLIPHLVIISFELIYINMCYSNQLMAFRKLWEDKKIICQSRSRNCLAPFANSAHLLHFTGLMPFMQKPRSRCTGNVASFECSREPIEWHSS